jgi:hypothetical protein
MHNGECRMKWACLASCILHSAFCICLAGCNVIGAVAAKVGPEPTVAAQFVPAQEPVVVLVENYHNPASLRLESDAVARLLSEELELNKVAPVVDPAKAVTLRQAKGSSYRQMPIDAIGKAVGATQIVYVDLERFDVDHALASELLTGEAEARVRVVDDTGELLWPLDSAGGYPVAVKIEPQRASSGGAGHQQVRQQLHAALADRVAKLFYKWKTEGSDSAEHKFRE